MPPSWLTGDQNGFLKLVTCQKATNEQLDPKNPSIKYHASAQILKHGDQDASPGSAIQKLSVGNHGRNLIAVAHSDTSTILFHADQPVEELEVVHSWEEPRRANTKVNVESICVGLDITPVGILQCTQEGYSRLTTLNNEISSHEGSVPMGIRHFKASKSGNYFAYAGKEVNLSVWDTEQAFSKQSSGVEDVKRRRSGEQLFKGEIWRAKNLPNDSLDLRQPVDIRALTFLSNDEESQKSSHLIAVGNSLGCVHTYDTRKGRKTASSWKDSRMSGGVSLIEKGIREHELYIADSAAQLWAIDRRKDTEPLYAYKGLGGKVTAISVSSSTGYIAASAFDRYFRLLSSPSNTQDGTLSGIGEVVGKLYTTAHATTIIPWDFESKDGATGKKGVASQDNEDNEITEDRDRDENENGFDWEGIPQVSDEEEDGGVVNRPKKRRKRD